MLKDLEKYVDSCVSRLQFKSFLTEEKTPHLEHLQGQQPPHATPSSTPTPEWIKVGSGFDSIAAGFQGLVCATSIRDSGSLYIRMGVAHDAPEGTSWAKIICEAIQIAVGKDCIVRKTSKGDLHVVNVREEYDNYSVSMIQTWIPINVHHLREIQQQEANGLSLQAIIQDEHLLLDERDRLFIVAPSGIVYGCLEPYSNDYDSQWVAVSPAPPIGNVRPSFLRSLYSFLTFSKNKASDGIFSQVCVGKSALWCVRADNYDLWQLLLSNFITSGGVTELKATWSHVPVPAEDERISLLAASKSTVDGIYAVMVKNSNGRGVIVAYSLNQTGSERVPIELPSFNDPKCLVIALSLQSATNNIASVSKARRIGKDICCENGDCSFCQNQKHSILTRPLFPSPPDSRMEAEEQGLPYSILGKRSHPDSNESSNEPRPKRRHSDRYPPPYCPLEGVIVQRNPQSIIDDHPNVCRAMNIISRMIVLILPLLQLPDPSVLHNPLPQEHIDTMVSTLLHCDYFRS